MPPLPRPVQVAAVIMTALAVGLFVAFWGLRVWLEKSGLSERIGHAVAEQASDFLGQPVHIGSVGLRGLNGVVLLDVRVGEPSAVRETDEPHRGAPEDPGSEHRGARTAGFRFAAEQVLIGIDPRILWQERRRDPASAVLAVKLVGATVDLPQRPDGSWALPHLPLTGAGGPSSGVLENQTWDGRIDIVQGSIRLTGRDFELALERLEGSVRHGDIRLSGQVDLKSASLALRGGGLFRLDGTFAALDRSYSGSLAIRGGLIERLTGAESSVQGRGAPSPDRARFEIPGDLAIAFHGAGPTLILDRWELPGFGGRLTGRAQAGLDSGRFIVTAGGEKLDPAQVVTGLKAWLPKMGVGGDWSGLDQLPEAEAVSGQLTAEGAGEWRLQRANGSVAVSSLQVGALLIDSVSVTGSWAAAAPGALRIAQASARRGQTAASVEGIVRFDQPDQPLDLEVRAENIDPQTWPVLAKWPVQGRFDVDGRLIGGFRAPRFAGTIRGGPGSLWSRRFEALTASLTADPGRITVAPLTLSVAGGHVTANGSVGLPASPGRLTDASLALDVAATALPVDAIAPGYKLPAEGPLSGNLRIRGTLAAPEVSGSVRARAAEWAGQRLEELSVTGRFAGSQLVVDEALGSWRGVRVRAAGRVDGVPSRAPVLALDIEAAEIPLAGVAEALALPDPWRPAGSAAVSGRLTGTWPAVAVTAQASGKEWAWRGIPFHDPVATAHWSGEGWDATLRARAFDRPLTLAAAGDRAGPRRVAFNVDQGELTAAIGVERNPIEVVARAFPAEWLVPLLPERSPLTPGGALSGRFTLAPPSGAPGGHPGAAPGEWSGRGEFDLGSLRVGPAELRAIRGQIGLGSSVLTLSNVTARLAGRDIQIDGSVPLVGTSARADLPQLDLLIQVPEGPLPAPGGLFPQIPGLNLSGGRLGAEVHVGGTLAAPRVDGNARLRDLGVAYPGLPGPLSGVNADVAFNGSRIQLNNVRAQMLGGSLTGDGVVALPEAPGQRRADGSPAARDARLDFRLRAENVRYSDPMVTATVSGDLTLSGPIGFPTVRGRLVLSKGTFKLASRASGPDGSRRAFDPALDVYLVPQDVRVNLPGVDVLAGGELRARGRLSRPTLSGQISASRGTLNYLGTVFTIQRAVADFADYRGVLPRLDVSAHTRLGRTEVTLTLSGTADALQTEFTTDPPMDRSEVFGLLGIPSAIHRLGESDSIGDVSQEVLRIVDDSLQNQVIGNLERAVRDALALDDFRLSPSLRDWRLGVHLGKTVLPNVYVSYERMLDASGDRNWSVEYQLTPQLKMTSRFGGQESWMGLEASWRF